MDEIGPLLNRVASGEDGAKEELWQLVYDELRRLAQARMARLAPGQTLQPTALVHEAFLRLHARAGGSWDGAAHFYGAAARAMRNVLVNAAQRQHRNRRFDRSGVLETLQGEDVGISLESVLVVDEALGRLRGAHPRVAEAVLLRFFAGLTIPEVGDALDVSHATVERDWAFARAWLARELSG